MQISRKGILSLQLSKELGITQKAPWFAPQGIRVAYGVSNGKKLARVIEIDKVSTGGRNRNRPASNRHDGVSGSTGKHAVLWHEATQW